jgi:hypothetical protein
MEFESSIIMDISPAAFFFPFLFIMGFAEYDALSDGNSVLNMLIIESIFHKLQSG